MNPIAKYIAENWKLRKRLLRMCERAGAPMTQQAIDGWKRSKKGVPPSRVMIVSKLLKIPPHEIRPDIFPPPKQARKYRFTKRGNNHAQQQRLF